MKAIDKAFMTMAALIQLAIAALLLWAGNTDSLNVVLANGQAASQGVSEIAKLISDYRQALGIAREIFIDVGIALLCSFGLTVIVLYRQAVRRDLIK